MWVLVGARVQSTMFNKGKRSLYVSVLCALGEVGKQTSLGLHKLHNTFQPSPYHHLDHEESSKLLFFYTYSFHPFRSRPQNKENGVQSMFSEYHNFVF